MTDTTYLADVNVLIALTNPVHVHHQAAHRWLQRRPAESMLATTPMTESAFVRLMINPAVAGRQIRPATAINVLRLLRGRPDHRFISDDSSLADAVVSVETLVGPKQVTALHLVNLAAATGCVLATFDSRLQQVLAPADRAHVAVIDQLVH